MSSSGPLMDLMIDDAKPCVTLYLLIESESSLTYLVDFAWDLYESTMQRHTRQAMGRSRITKPRALPNPMVYCELIQELPAEVLSDTQAVLAVSSCKDGCLMYAVTQQLYVADCIGRLISATLISGLKFPTLII